MIKPRKNIQELKPYKAVQIDADFILNANETENYLYPQGYKVKRNYALYPEAQGQTLRQEIGKKYSLSKEEIIIGNGSTQLLELIIRTYCEPKDKILTFTPTFSMYEIYAKAQDVDFLSVSLEDDMTLDEDALIQKANLENISIIILCNPNNPTGTLLKRETILNIVGNTQALVIVDEAYMEFDKEENSVVDYVTQTNQLIIARTFSKAYGLASLRLGYVIANKLIIEALLKTSLPYNVNAITQEIGLDALKKEQEMRKYVNGIVLERDRVIKELIELQVTVFPSATNFIYIYSEKDLFQIFLDKGVLIRSFQNNFFRITIQNKQANNVVISILKEVQS